MADPVPFGDHLPEGEAVGALFESTTHPVGTFAVKLSVTDRLGTTLSFLSTISFAELDAATDAAVTLGRIMAGEGGRGATRLAITVAERIEKPGEGA